MNDLMQSMKNRLSSFLSATTTLTRTYFANTNPPILYVADATYFNIANIMKNYPQITIFVPNGSGGYTKHRSEFTEVDLVNKTITLSAAVDGDLTVGSYVKRTPNWQEIKRYMLGDPAVIEAYPAICIVPSSKENTWQTLTGTKDHKTLNIIAHVIDDNQENSTITCSRIAEDIEDLLMGDLHLKISGRDVSGYNRTYNSFVTGIQYAYSNKGQFLKSAQITWFGDEFWGRFYLVQPTTWDSFE
jgi:hypothetical protein